MTQNVDSIGRTVYHRHLARFSPQLMDDVIETAQAEHMQVGKGTFEGDLLRVISDDKVIDSGAYSQGILGRATMSTERVTIGMVLPAQVGGKLEGCGLDSPTIFLYTEGVELGCRLEPGTRWLTFQIPRREIEACGLVIPETYNGVVVGNSKSPSRLMNGLSALLSDFAAPAASHTVVRTNARLVEERIDGLLAAFINILSPEPRKPHRLPPQRYQKLVSSIQEYIDAHLGDPVRIRELCAISGVSYSTLERAFVGILGVTPKRYLSIIRLTHARRLLLDGSRNGTRIADISMACGFDELGRFSRDYRQWFGESPSRTFAQLE